VSLKKWLSGCGGLLPQQQVLNIQVQRLTRFGRKIMANKRMINGDTFEDEFFTTLSIFGRLLWIGCITKLADDQGRFRDNAALIRSNLFPMDDIPLNDIEKAIQLFSIDGRILRYEKDGKKLIQIVNWWKHQKPRWASASNYPAPDGWVDRYRYHGEGNKILESNWNSIGGYIADSTVCEDEDDIKDDVKDEEEFSNFDDVQRYLEKTTGYPPNGSKAVEAINEILEIVPTAGDIKAAYKWLVENGVNVKYYQKIVNPIRTAKAMRLKENIGEVNRYESAKVYDE
jgi:hypothetical protein